VKWLVCSYAEYEWSIEEYDDEVTARAMFADELERIGRIRFGVAYLSTIVADATSASVSVARSVDQ
jgi:hypothetical protein